MTDFSTWYTQYPKKVARKDAERAWSKLTLPQRQMALDALPAHVHRWRMTATGWDFLPHPASWLNGHRFEDVLPINSNGAPAAPSGPMPADSPLLVAAGAPPVRVNGPVPLSTIFAGLKQQLKRG